MGKKITIYKGDEYRAKIAKTFQPDDIFADVYSKAYRIVDKITGEMREYEEQCEKANEKRKKYSARYSGMGNNIVIFCGARGQGKTSAMQTFARCLGGEYREEDKIKELKIKEGAFEVLDSIDPSAMENDESILRVLLSRLFFQLQELITDSDFTPPNDNEFAKDKANIVKLFQKCYANIDYIQSGKRKESGQDDLEKIGRAHV